MEKITIIPPNGCDKDEIRYEFRSLNSGFVSVVTYPNGVEMVVTHMNGSSNVETSKPLVKIDDHTYQIPD